LNWTGGVFEYAIQFNNTVACGQGITDACRYPSFDIAVPMQVAMDRVCSFIFLIFSISLLHLLLSSMILLLSLLPISSSSLFLFLPFAFLAFLFLPLLLYGFVIKCT
jgi:hypothetical protein